MYSVVILTLNEERNLPACLASLTGCNDIVVLDSGSTDRTQAIAKAAGARVVERRFTNFGDQRNFANAHIPFKNDWVFHLDADEQMTLELHRECSGLSAQGPGGIDGFMVAPRMFYHGRWIPHCTDYPAFQARFVHPRRFRFIQAGHGQREDPTMHMGILNGNYLHNLSADTDEELEAKHRRYAVQEAEAFLNRAPNPTPLWRRLFSSDKLVRRRALKHLSQRLPMRGPLRFIYQYLWRHGFLDGIAGLRYCLLLSRYESWIAQEIRRQKREHRNTP
ncbi:MAG: glycosyltransferase family 2 protein [Nibricoccus sp.]